MDVFSLEKETTSGTTWNRSEILGKTWYILQTSLSWLGNYPNSGPNFSGERNMRQFIQIKVVLACFGQLHMNFVLILD